MCMSRPARVWLFNSDTVGLCEFRPLQSIGSGHAMGWRAGMEFTMMEKSVRAEFSAAGRSFPPYGTGNNHNTWYAATMVDARGVEIPYVDRDGRELPDVSSRYRPAPGQKFFLKGGVIDNPKYEYRGPETLDFEELMRRGYQMPFYADLSRMPEMERKVIRSRLQRKRNGFWRRCPQTRRRALTGKNLTGRFPKRCRITAEALNVRRCFGKVWTFCRSLNARPFPACMPGIPMN